MKILENSVIGVMEKELNEQINKFDKDIYRNLLLGYESINKLQTVPGLIQDAFSQKINSVYEKIVENGNFKNPKQYIQLLNNVIESFYTILNVHLQIVNWHRSANEFETIRKSIEDIDKAIWDNAEINVTNIILKALEAPLSTIAHNAGLEGAVIINKVRESEIGTGFNILKEEYTDMVAAGIVDPAKVTRSALQNATSVASTLLTTESVVSTIKEDAPAAMPAGGAPMGMM